jgi:ATP-dependent Zn protease
MAENSSTLVDPQRLATAYHEAGHAVMGCIVGDPPLSATIVPDGKGAVGKVKFEAGIPEFAKSYLNDSPAKRQYAEQRILVELAGTAAHNLLEPGRPSDLGDQTDADSARDFARELVSWEDQSAYLCRARDEAETRLKAHWPWLEAVAAALLQHETLSRADILALRPAAAPENQE